MNAPTKMTFWDRLFPHDIEHILTELPTDVLIFNESKKEQHNTFFKTLPKNIFSGFVVSLIALPLGLGLAMASDAPPIAGIIAAVVGGIIVSILGGSHVTIAGPGNGLVGVILVAITTLGLENAYVAIVFSGVLLM